MTAMPQRIALVLTLGALATALVGVIEYHTAIMSGQFISRVEMTAIGFEVLLGTVTASATIIAVGKLREWVTSRPVTYRGQEFINGSAAAFIVGMLVYVIVYPPTAWAFYTTIALAFVLGVMLVMPTDGADTPVVVAALNSYSGLAAFTAGFVTNDVTLIFAGLLVGLSGSTLSLLMRKR